MERKLVKQGQNALTVTLPAQWLRQYKLSAGKCVDVNIYNENLVVSTSKQAPSASATISAAELEPIALWQSLLSVYLDGHDEIIIVGGSQESIHRYVSYLLGFAIDRASVQRTVLKSIIAQPTETLSELLSRIRYQFLALATGLRAHESYELVKQKEHVLDTTIYYTMRFLRKYSTLQQDYRHFVMCLVLEAAADNVSELLMFEPAKHNIDSVMMSIELFCGDSYPELLAHLSRVRKTMPKKTFADGLSYAIIETLFNISGYVAQDPWQ